MLTLTLLLQRNTQKLHVFLILEKSLNGDTFIYTATTSFAVTACLLREPTEAI